MRAFLSTAALAGIIAGALATLGCSGNEVATPSPSTNTGGGTGPGGGGSPSAASGKTWSASYGSAGKTQQGYGIAVDPMTNAFVIAGALAGTVNFGGEPLASAGGSDVFVAKFDAEGHHLWSERFGDASDQFARAVAIDPAGDVLLVGSFQGTLDFGHPELGVAPLVSAGGRDIFIAKLTPSGVIIYAHRYGGRFEDDGEALAVGADGSVAFVGSTEGGTESNTVMASAAAPASAGMVVKLDAKGGPLWNTTFGGISADTHLASIALDPHGNLAVTGTYKGNLDFGAPGQYLSGSGAVDVFLAAYSGQGNLRWERGFRSVSPSGVPAEDNQAIAVTYDGAGDLIALGNYWGSPELGGGSIPNFGGELGGYDIYLSKYTSEGAYVWANHYGSPHGYDYGDALVTGREGEIYLAGHARSAMPFGFCQLQTRAAGGKLFVGVVDPTGKPLCGTTAGNGTLTQANALVVDTVGRLGLIGSFDGTVDFGEGALTAVGSRDAFVARNAEPPRIIRVPEPPGNENK